MTCPHVHTEDVHLLTGGVVAVLCLDCDAQLAPYVVCDECDTQTLTSWANSRVERVVLMEPCAEHADADAIWRGALPCAQSHTT